MQPMRCFCAKRVCSGANPRNLWYSSWVCTSLAQKCSAQNGRPQHIKSSGTYSLNRIGWWLFSSDDLVKFVAFGAGEAMASYLKKFFDVDVEPDVHRNARSKPVTHGTILSRP
eukprot:4643340-Amphidinium_carterae.2